MEGIARTNIFFIAICLLLFFQINSEADSLFTDDDSLWFNTDKNAPPSVSLYFFWSNHCPHCLEARPYIEALSDQYPWLKLYSYELFESPENRSLFLDMASLIKAPVTSVPAFMLCGKMYTGWRGEKAGVEFIQEKLHTCYQQIYGDQTPVTSDNQQEQIQATLAGLPLIGELNAGQYSLPVLTILLAGMDAFNPCAFFVLLFLLSLMVHLDNRRRMLFIGGLFVLVSGLVYFSFMAAWLNIFMLFGEIRAVTRAAGSVALLIATINIKDYFWFKEGISLTLNESQKQSIFQRARRLLHADNMPALLVGTVLLALAANMYELLCTAGFPMVYTRILTLNDISSAHYYLFLALYNIIYVTPLLAIVLLFSLTHRVRKLSESQGRFLKLLSGSMMLGLGLLLLIAPEHLSNLFATMALFLGAIVLSILVARIMSRLQSGRSNNV